MPCTPRLLALLPVLLLGCRNMDRDGAEALWDEVHEYAYRTWQRAPGYPTRTASSTSHGNMVDIYVNDILADTLASGEALTAWPEGSVIVKDGFKGDDPLLVAIMEMRDDGWYFAEYEPDGHIDFSGRPRTCLKCHGDDTGAAGVLAFAFPGAATP